MAFSSACHHGEKSPTSASTDRTSGLTVVSLRTGAPIENAAVVDVLGGRSVTDARGFAEVSATFNGAIITVTAPAFMGPYRFVYAPGMRLSMIPSDAQMPESWLLDALYGGDGFQWLWRPEPGTIVVVPSPELLNDEFSYNGITAGIAIINARHRYIRFELKSQSSAGDRVASFVMNPAAGGYATTAIIARPGSATTIGATVEFSVKRIDGLPPDKQRLHFTRVVAHELAHVAGLSGHPRPIAGIYSMGMMWGAEPVQDFAEPEVDIMNWEFTLPPGTRPMADMSALPVSASARGGGERHVVCTLKH
jgi:hypothetical protein